MPYCPLCGQEVPSGTYTCRHCRNNVPTDSSGKPLLLHSPPDHGAQLSLDTIQPKSLHAYEASDQAVLAPLVPWIVSQRKVGISASQVIASLWQGGISQELAAPLVRHVYDSVKPDLWHRPLSWRGVVLALAVFVGLNASLYAVQEYLARDQVKRCEALETQLKAELHEVTRLESLLTAQQRTSELTRKTIEEMQNRLGDPSRGFVDARAFRRERSRYERLVTGFNKELEDFKLAIERHDRMVDAYNTKIGQYNRLAESAYARYILWPTVAGGRSLARRPPFRR